jgi:hypothetical protein
MKLYRLELNEDAALYLTEEEYAERAHLYAEPTPIDDTIFAITRRPVTVVADEVVADLAEPVTVVADEVVADLAEPVAEINLADALPPEAVTEEKPVGRARRKAA